MDNRLFIKQKLSYTSQNNLGSGKGKVADNTGPRYSLDIHIGRFIFNSELFHTIRINYNAFLFPLLRNGFGLKDLSEYCYEIVRRTLGKFDRDKIQTRLFRIVGVVAGHPGGYKE